MAHLPVAALPLPLAAADWLELVLPVIFVIFWLVSQIVALVQRVRGVGNAAPPQRPPVVVQARPRPPVAPPAPGDRLELEIEAFRRAQAEAAAKRDPAPRPAAPARPQPRPPVRQGEARPGEPARPPQGQRPAPAQRAAAAQPVQRATATRPAPSAPPRPVPGGVARHVEEAFSHDLAHSAGAIHSAPGAAPSSSTAAADAADRSTAAAIVAMMRSPASVRQALLLREILDRPVHRW